MVCLSTVSLAATNLKTPPNSRPSAETRYAQVIALLDANKLGEASGQIDQLLKDFPNHVPSLVLRGQLSERSANYSAAQEAYEKALKLVPHDPQILYLLGAHWAQREEWEKSVRYLKASLQLHPLNPDALSYLAQAYQKSGDKQRALETLQHGVKAFPDNAAFCQQLGLFLCANSQYPEGLKWLLRAERLNAGLENLNGQIGSLYHRNREALQAIPYLEKEFQKHPGDPELSSMLGDDYSQLSNWEKARTCYLQALDGGRTDPLTYYGLGRALVGLGDYQAAVAPLKQALGMNLKLVEAHFQLGKAYQGLGRKEEAAYEQMVFQVLNDSLHNPPPGKKVLTPQEAEIKIKCQKLLENNQEEEALSVLKAAGAPPLLSPAQPYLQLGEIYFALNRFNDAKRLLLQGLDLDPKFPSINSCLGATYASLGDLEKAEGAFRSELVMDDSQLVALLGLGQVKYRQRRWREAAEYFGKAKTTDPFVLYLASDCYFHLGQTAKASVAAELFGVFYNGDKELLEALVRLLRSQNQHELADRLQKRGS
jgi:tetratricopeptide (TPR) repeat protein